MSTLERIAERLAVKAVRTCFCGGPDPYVVKLLKDTFAADPGLQELVRYVDEIAQLPGGGP